ncbi:MAG TPA: PstS family phosphate ABC transporter substrate-binding protein [Polyangiaceae bacterium]|nr:PstS family phosphate ABC transporter substrate-binding protein [Polyangiaceae bacterium]
MRSAIHVSLLALAFSACTRTESSSGTASGDAGAAATTVESKTLAVKGSDTMVILGQRWAETYMKANPGVTVQVTGGGSGTGIAALINGTTDICESSRPMKDKEKEDVQAKRGAPAVETKVALDALAVYVNEKSPLQEIAIPALGRIYKGETKNWKDVGGPDHSIVLYGRENNSGTYGYFKEHVLENKDFAASVQTLAGTSAVVSAVKGDAFGIGYGGIAYLEGIRALKVKKEDSSPAIAASLQTAQDGSYPLARFLFFYTAGEPKGLAKRFIDWVQAPDGQKVIEQVGYYPLPK